MMPELSLIVPSRRHLVELAGVYPQMLDVLGDLMHIWPGPVLLGDIYRDPDEEARLGRSGIHGAGPPYRAVDVRTSSLGVETDAHRWAICQRVAAELNNLWIYDPSRGNLRVAIGDPHGTAPHLHLQVHPATERQAEFDQRQRSHV